MRILIRFLYIFSKKYLIKIDYLMRGIYSLSVFRCDLNYNVCFTGSEMLTECSPLFALPFMCRFLLEAWGHVSKPFSKVVFLQDYPVRELGSGRKFSVKVNVNPYLQCSGSMTFCSGSGSGSWIRILSLTFKMPTKNNCSNIFLLFTVWRYIYIIFER